MEAAINSSSSFSSAASNTCTLPVGTGLPRNAEGSKRLRLMRSASVHIAEGSVTVLHPPSPRVKPSNCAGASLA